MNQESESENQNGVALPQRGLRTLHLFAGAGGGILADKLLGHVPVCAVEIDPYARAVLFARQRDGCLDPFPIWDDVTTFDGRPWCGSIDVVSGGFPCQDISCAGKGKGLSGERSGLWSEMARIIGEVRPRFAFVENSPMLLSRGFGTVLGDLASMGYDARWGIVSAESIGFNHRRERLWIVADSLRPRLATNMLAEGGIACGGDEREGRGEQGRVHESPRLPSRSVAPDDEAGKATAAWINAPCEPLLLGIPDGVSRRVDRLRVVGNAQIPNVAATAWRILANGAS